MQEVLTATANLIEQDDSFSLRLARKPAAVVAEARECANELIKAVKQNGWVQKYGAREHLFFEAWACLATMYRVTPRTRETRLIDLGDARGYEAVAEAWHNPSQSVISVAEAMCLNDEENWDRRPKYDFENGRRVRIGDVQVPLFQLRSMAQTRAMSKALRGPFSWIVAMAGYAPQPAEELHGEPIDAGQPIASPRQKPAAAVDPDMKITPKQATRIWGVAFGAGVDKKITQQILEQYGFHKADEVTAGKYDEIIAAIQQAGQPQSAPDQSSGM